MTTTKLKVQGMKCGGCETSVKEALSGCPGVISVNASHKAEAVEVEHDAKADFAMIRKAIAEKGFTVVD